jgi:heme/copper-type cytochrome/quinol oxidase subunit 2
MSNQDNRRGFMKLLGVGGVVFASGLAGCSNKLGKAGSIGSDDQDFFFMQMSDTHWGFSGPPNPEADVTLKHAVAAINASDQQPDFIVFTGDLTHTTDDPAVRRQRMQEFKQIVAGLHVKDIKFVAGEHDASLDAGAAFVEAFGPLHHTFDHKGVHFIVLDNVSDPAAQLGADQLQWLRDDLDRLAPEVPVVVFAHRPLFDLYPSWDWATKDGALAVQILQTRKAVTVFYGHIHQEYHSMTGDIAHHAARSLIFPLPAPGSVPKRAPLPWDPAATDHGLGYREVRRARPAQYDLKEIHTPSGADAAALPPPTTAPDVVTITAKRFEFSPAVVTLKRGVPVVLELTSLDRVHGFAVPDLGIDTQINPAQPTRITVVPDKVGTFQAHCNVFCGDGHEGMTAQVVVTP